MGRYNVDKLEDKKTLRMQQRVQEDFRKETDKIY